MPSKLQLDKAAWLWAETTDPPNVTIDNVRTAYRLNLQPCQLGACKRNCRGNPFCLNGLGEKAWFAQLDERPYHDFDPDAERREKNSFVGLKNLGATCYVNTFLQLWFHNASLRQAIYRWREPTMDEASKDWTPSSICGHLQVVFALLQFSQRRYIDPSALINHLGLDAGQQQDAQEFSKLFLSLLEDSLSSQVQPDVPNIVQKQFCGQYCYVTSCKHCGNQSRTASKFYELDLSIKGHKTLKASLEDFLQEEKLEGENQYMCSMCNSKQNASRVIQLDYLPPVLSLQLLRFVFDKKSGHKKKLNSFIQFPQVLDMSKYLGKPENSVLFDLTAVLIHRGPSAYSGHYVAHIQDTQQETWYKFNDEEIEQMKGRHLQLGNEEEPHESSQKIPKNCKATKGCYSSKNAYMLVYTRQGVHSEEVKMDDAFEESLLPTVVKQMVQKDNDSLETWICELISTREQDIETSRNEQEKVKDTFLSLHCKPDSDFEWISSDWLSKWLANPNKTSPIKQDVFLCHHERLNPEAVPKLKCISAQSSEALFDKFSGGPRLKGTDSMCEKCVRQKCLVIRLKQSMVEDEKFFAQATRTNQTSELCFWVGKASFRSWKRLALDRISRMEVTNCVQDQSLQENGTTQSESEHPTESSSASDVICLEKSEKLEEEKSEKLDEELRWIGSEPGCDRSQSGMLFNDDLLCDEHECLSPDEGCRRLVSPEVWQRLKKYFPDCPEYNQLSQTCYKCQLLNQEEKQEKDYRRLLAQEQKSVLLDLFHGKNRPLLDGDNELQANIISTFFIKEWRRFLKDCTKVPPVSEITNSVLLCEHGGLVYSPENRLGGGDFEDIFTLVWPSEWEKMIRLCSFDTEITLVRLKEDDNTFRLVTSPEMCEDCVSLRLAEEESLKYFYEDVTIYVRKVLSGDTSASMEPENGDKDSSFDRTDPEFSENTPTKLSSDCDEPPEKMSKINENGAAVRKSRRHRKQRGEKEVLISSNMNLKDLKLKIMKQFAVPPFDQNLSLDGVKLTDDAATLSSLKVFPGCVVILQADEPSEDALAIEELFVVPAHPEEGFKGTNLLSTRIGQVN
ncbi:ubiquitin carboxyl-terminal hydrolase 48-like isoform X2 [Gigantopelta aegis]|uniref:ubiquitin carboxyl-terminal hydrolase 48-like isoform X2 n=1 Tax=Gigantopelta aegis TaxID=1735272 RepID=UPI001B887BA2|nr:ubiquitin carboxyl-terminal hydrolase 48-like isoform X2 [Gigantopelta aegis]